MGLFHKIATRFIRKSQSLLGASTIGVRVLVVDQDQKILLVKHTYVPGWHFPGGGVNKGEMPKLAALRELREETGVIAQDPIELLGIYYHRVHYVDDYPILYLVKEFTQEASSSPEIAQVEWFYHQDLPDDTTNSTKRRVAEYFHQQEKVDIW